MTSSVGLGISDGFSQYDDESLKPQSLAVVDEENALIRYGFSPFIEQQRRFSHPGGALDKREQSSPLLGSRFSVASSPPSSSATSFLSPLRVGFKKTVTTPCSTSRTNCACFSQGSSQSLPIRGTSSSSRKCRSLRLYDLLGERRRLSISYTMFAQFASCVTAIMFPSCDFVKAAADVESKRPRQDFGGALLAREQQARLLRFFLSSSISFSSVISNTLPIVIGTSFQPCGIKGRAGGSLVIPACPVIEHVLSQWA